MLWMLGALAIMMSVGQTVAARMEEVFVRWLLNRKFADEVLRYPSLIQFLSSSAQTTIRLSA